MEYPKQVMKITELTELGFPKEWLMKAYRNKSQNFAWKIDMTKRNSPIVFDTKGLEEYRLKMINAERIAIARAKRVM